MEEIWVFIEQDDGVIEESSLEVLSKAWELADKGGYGVTAILMGSGLADKARDIGRYGAHKVYYIDDANLRSYSSELYPMVMEWLIKKYDPNTVLFSATRNGRDLAGRIAVKFKSGLLAHVIELGFDENGDLVGKVPGFGGNIAAVVKCVDSRPQLATVTPGVFEARDVGAEAELKVVTPDIELKPRNIRIVSKERGEYLDISKSERVVVAGMGTGGKLDMVRELAKLLNADIGVTRPLADIGVAPRDIQIGSTGVTLKSKLAFILGASGAPHFTSGIKDCGVVITVNKDPEAPIKDYSDYLVVGDIFEVIPRLIKLLRGEEIA